MIYNNVTFKNKICRIYRVLVLIIKLIGKSGIHELRTGYKEDNNATTTTMGYNNTMLTQFDCNQL